MNDENKRWARRLLGILLGILVIIILANAALIYYAQTSFTGLSTEKAYEKGLAYNQTLQEEAAQKALGWNLASTPAWQGATTVMLSYTLTQSDTTPLPGATLTVQATRPMADAPSQTLVLNETAPGTHTGTLTLPKPGQWVVTTTATRGTNTFQATERLTTPHP